MNGGLGDTGALAELVLAEVIALLIPVVDLLIRAHEAEVVDPRLLFADHGRGLVEGRNRPLVGSQRMRSTRTKEWSARKGRARRLL
jgi:hypothetical protein